MSPWEIWSADIHGEHPVVIISHADRVARKQDVVVLMGVTLRGDRVAEPHEFILDQADGLDWKTLVKCELPYTIPKARLTRKRGEVTRERRREIARRVIQGLAFAGF